MAIKIVIYKEEKDKLIIAISKHAGETISVAKLAKEAGLNPNRSRFIIEEMLDEGTIRKIETKNFNAKYKRYGYILTGK